MITNFEPFFGLNKSLIQQVCINPVLRNNLKISFNENNLFIPLSHMNKQTKENLIRRAMDEAEKGIKKSNSPFGAVLTDKKGNIVEAAYNTSKTDCDPTAHAEINLLRKAGKKFKTRVLEEYCLFSNAESCSMCMSAAIKAGITFFYFGAPSEKNMDPYLTVFDVAKKSKRKLHIETGLLKEECIAQIIRGRNKLLK